ncbi:MAG: T9SS type A sorting domain-containing protein [Bacteroidota bacterium]
MDYGHSSTAQLTTNDNALGLLRGTVRLNTNVDVPLLNNTGNYNISESARLWVNGGSTTKAGGEAIVPYGIIQVSDGTLDAPVRSGITTRDNGTIIVEGGIVTVNQIRTSVLGAANIGGYFQSGGTVDVTGQNVQQNYYTFSLTYPGNTFNMSGGTLRVAGSDTFNDNTGGTSGQIHGGGIFIDSDPGNISVTGGTVIMENNTNIDFKVTSRAPFWNVIMRSTGGTATDIDLASGTSGDNSAGEFETILNPELLVLNDLTVEDGVSFDPNGNDIEVGSDLIIEDGAEWDVPLNTAPSAPYTLTLNGIDDSVLRLDHATQVNCPTCPVFSVDQRFSNLVINKPDGIRVRLDASAQRDTEIAGEANPDANNLVDVRGTFDLQNGIFDITDYSLRLNTTDVRIDGILSEYVEGVTDVNSQVKFRAATFMVQNTADAVIGNLRFRASNDIVTLQNDLTVRRLQFESGLLNIEDNNLRVENFVEALRASEANFGGCVGGCYSIEDMIVTSASASDGGLSILVDGDGTYEFPFGITNPSSKYTPAVVSVSGFGGDGYLTIRPVDGELLTTEPLGGDVLSYYWRVNFEGFSAVPNVSYQFIYDEDDVDLSANESSFVAGKVLDAAPFTRRFEDDNLFGVPGVVEFEGVDDTNNTIDFNGDADNGFPLEVANYTAGESGRFSGAPTIYYTRKISNGDQDWSNINTWSTTAVQGPVAGTIPGAGDVVIIGAHNGTGLGFSQNPIRLDVDINATVARLEFETAGAGESRGRLFPEPGTSQNWGQVIGNGEIQLFFSNSGDVPTFDATNDLGDFLGNTSSTWNLAHQGGTGTGNAVTMPSFPAEFPNLRITATGGSNGGADGWGSQRIITFTNDIQVNNELQIANRAALWVQSNINVDDDLDVGIGFGHGRLRFDNGNTPYTVTVCNNITVGGTTNGTIDDSFIDVESAGTGTAIHRLQVGGDINLVQNGNGTDGIISLSNPDTDDSQVIIELIKEGANQLANGTDQTPDFYRIEMNKGVDPSSSFEFISNLNINGSSGLIEKAIELNNGLLRFNDPSISIELTTGGGSFSIPSSSGLQLTQGTFTVSGDDIGIILDGSLIIDGGTLDMDDAVGNGNNFIEYSASGNALLEISSGTLNVGSQIRGITTAETGVLRYRQTGGDVRIGTQAGPENTRGMLQIYNTGSEFTFTGGTLQIERHQSSPSVAALFLNPDDSDVTQPIQIFNGDTPAGQNDFRINSAIPLQELVIGGTNSPSAELDINALTIEGNLTIEAGGTLNANGRTLTVGGDFDNDGTYDAQSNETIFNSTGVQQITGAGFFNFFRFTKSETGTLDLTSTLNVSDLFTISGGILSDNGNTINLAADAVIDGTHSSTGGNGIVFSGGTAQELRRSSAGTGTLGTITINNSNGVNIPDGNGYNFNIDGGLRLENGVFNVGGSEILFGISAEITEVNTFGVNNMIRTNSSFTDGGVGKVFAAGPRADFIFPVGQSFFTPVTLTALNIGSTGGTINILPANEVHPTINDGVPDPDDPLATGDVNNALQYYWTVRSSGLNGFTAEANFQYDQSDVLTAEPGLDEDDYIAARILSQNNPTFAINKFLPPPDDLDETNNIITFRFNSVSSDGISGDYFAGIDEAIPDVVVTYIVQGVGGDANTEVYDLDVPGVGNYPSGSVVIIPSGATLTLPVGADGIRLYAMEIQDGGILEIDNSTNHRLGELTGTGTLRILGNSINANLPAFSGDFLSCSGGGLEYGGTGSYSVLGGITEIRNLSFIGSGDRDLPNNNVRVCEDLVVNGPTLNLVPFRRVDVDNDFIINNGVVNSGTSFTTILNDFNIFGGTYEAQNGGNLRIVGDLTINGGTYIAGSAGNLRLEGDLNYTSGLYTQGSGSHRIFMQGVTPQIIRGDFIGSSAFYRLQISNPSGVLLENANIQIQNVLFLFDGLLTTSGFSLSLLSNGITVPTIGSSTSYINGQLNKVVSSSGSSFTFPIGSASRWRPASVNNVSDGGLTWSAEYFDASATTDPLVDNLDATNGGTGPGQIQTVSNGEYWIISDDAGTTPPPGVTATVGLSWGSDSDVSPVFAQREELEVMIWNDGLSSWDNLDGTGFSSGHTQSEGRFTAISSNSFSQQIFTLGSTTATNALPVELLKFEGETLKGNNYLTWETASELNNDFFELQRSSDGFDYETIARVDGQGTTVQITKYEYVDSNPLSGFNYYRLTQTDIDGTITIYNSAEWIVLLTITSEEIEFGFKAYPNPTDQNNINLKVDADQNLPLTIQMVDIYGRIVFQKLFEAGEFTRDMRIDASQNLRQGVYIIVAEQNSKRLTKRVIISE